MPRLFLPSSRIGPGNAFLSVSARNVPREFEVFYTVFYSLRTEEETLLSTRSQTLTRDYTWDETLVLGKEKEEQIAPRSDYRRPRAYRIDSVVVNLTGQ